MSKLTPLQKQQIRNALKRANERIAAIGREYGTDSSTYKQEAGKFEKGAYQDYVTKSKAGKKFYRKDPETGERYLYSESKGGNIKFDIKKIMKLIDDEGNSSKVNAILSESAGIKLYRDPIKDKEGNIIAYQEDIKMKDLKGGGIPTMAKLDKRIEKKLMRMGEDPGDYTKKELRAEGEKFAKFSENFQTSYDSYIAKFGEAEARKDSTVQLLYGDFRDRRLTRAEMDTIKSRMDERIAEAAGEALTFESDNEGDL